jgi:hypothetical protein
MLQVCASNADSQRASPLDLWQSKGLVGEPTKGAGDISRLVYDCLGKRIRRPTSHKPRTISIITTGACLANTVPTAPAISPHFRAG